jgi:Cysteine-rich secretory protein family
VKKQMRHLKNYFIPHAGNDHKPHSLRHKSVLTIFLLIIIIELGFFVQIFIVFDKTNFLASVLPGVLTALTNDDRRDNSLSPLVENELLTKAAEAKAQDMAKNGYFAHTSPEGKTPWYWFDQAGYKYTYAGENLAVNFFDSEEVEQAWMNSPTHRANIVKENYTEIGIGIASGIYQGRNTVFVAQLFGKPAPIIPENIMPDKIVPVVPIKQTPKVVPVAPKPAPAPVPAPVPTPAPVVAQNPQPTSVTVLGEETTSVVPVSNIKAPSPNFLHRILTSPRSSVSYAYMVISLFVFFALALYIFIKSEIKHPVMIARGAALIVVIAVLSFVNLRIFNLQTKIPSDITANVIQSLQ